MITARMARELSSVPILGEEPFLRNVQEKIINTATQGYTSFVFTYYFEPRTLDLLRDLGYIVNEIEQNSRGKCNYYISW